jgi:fatty-acyl-CoA synthase
MSGVRTLPGALAEAARSDRGYIFVDSHKETRRSYAAVYEASLRVARALRELGLGRGDVVALVIADSEWFLTALFGASIAGVVPASLYPPAPTNSLPQYLAATAGLLRSCGARAVVTTESLRQHFDGLRTVCPELSVVVAAETLEAPSGPLAPGEIVEIVETGAPVEPDDIAFVQFTSGSTTLPKGVVVTHRNLSANIEAFSGPAGVGASESDMAVSWLPLYHDMGLVGMAIGALYTRVPAVLLTPQTFVKRPIEWLRAISRHKGTISFAPNFAYDLCVRRVKDADLKGLDLSSWRVAGCGAEPIHAPTLAAFAEKFQAAGFRETSFLPCYGLAEHVLAAALPPRGRRLRVERLAADDLAVRRIATTAAIGDDDEPFKVVSCGLPLPGHQIRISDEHGRPLPERGIGEIALAGPSVTTGYYKDEALTGRVIRDGWLYTGDLGYLSNGELFVCGRVKDIIVINGRKFHPQDLEWCIDDLAGIKRGRVVAFGTAERGKRECAVIVVEPSGTVPADRLADAIRGRIADLCGLLVDHIVLVPSGTVTRTTSGKVRRAATKMRYERGELVTGAGGRLAAQA